MRYRSIDLSSFSPFEHCSNGPVSGHVFIPLMVRVQKDFLSVVKATKLYRRINKSSFCGQLIELLVKCCLADCLHLINALNSSQRQILH